MGLDVFSWDLSMGYPWDSDKNFMISLRSSKLALEHPVTTKRSFFYSRLNGKIIHEMFSTQKKMSRKAGNGVQNIPKWWLTMVYGIGFTT